MFTSLFISIKVLLNLTCNTASQIMAARFTTYILSFKNYNQFIQITCNLTDKQFHEYMMAVYKIDEVDWMSGVYFRW